MPSRTTAEWLSHIRQLGLSLTLDGDRLACSAPKHVLTPELKAELVRRKPEILELLRAASPGTDSSPQLIRLPGQTDLPLSSGQQRLWFFEQFHSSNSAYTISFSIEFKGLLDVAALESSLQEILRRHEVLTSRFVVVRGSPRASLAPTAQWKLRKTCLRDASGNPRELAASIAKEQARQGFDLSTGPLLRTNLLSFDDNHHILAVTIHHIAADGWSIAILLRDLGELYEAYSQQRPAALPELPVQYADYAAWQNQMRDSELVKRQLHYWRKQLQEPLPILELPSDRPRPAQPSFRGARKRFSIPSDVASAVGQLAKKEHVTHFVVLLGAFKVLLNRYTGQEDLAVGSAVAGRNRPELENLIGLFINNLVLRTSVAGDPTVRELLSRVQETCLSAFAHQDVPFDQVVAELQPTRNLDRTPFFQVMFILQNYPAASFELPGLSAKPLYIDARTSRFDLTLEATEMGDGSIGLDLEYRSDLFDEATISRLVDHYRRLLTAMTASPEERISALQMVGAEEAGELLAASGSAPTAYPGNLGLHDLVEAQARQTPDRVAVIYDDREITYHELNKRANQLANRLRRLGIGPDQLVGICLDRSPDMLVAVLGVLKAGGAYVPLDPHFPAERLADMAQDAAVRVLLTDEQSRTRVQPPGAAILSVDGDLDSISLESEIAPPRLGGPEHLAYVIYTSGSTGFPRGVQVTHRSVINLLESMRQEPGIRATDRLLSVTTLSFDIAGLELFLPLLAGASVVLASRSTASDAYELARCISRSKATIMQATPATWRMLLDSGWAGKQDLMVLCGGETLPRELANRLLPKCAQLWNLYGPTETTIWSTLHRVTAGTGPVPIGLPIANTQVLILDERRQLVPRGVPGELYIGGDGLARGYHNRSDLTAEKFVAHPFLEGERLYRTGDRVRQFPNGDLQFLGRLDNQIKIRGFRVEPGEIEGVLKCCPGVSEVAVLLREIESGSPRLIAYLVPQAGAELSPRKLRADLLRTLPDYMVPSGFVIQSSFPLTPNRKIDRKALPPPRFDELPASEARSPASHTEKAVAAIWKELLKRDHVSAHDNFFDLGGHSLLLVQLQSRLKHRFSREIPMLELFQKPTISAMAELVADKAGRLGSERAAQAGTPHA